MIKPGLGSVDSMFLVPGDEAEFEDAKDVPHGEIRIAWYRSDTLDALRSMHVYTPPGYERDARSTRSSTCCTAPATRTRAGARSAAPASSSTT